MRKPKNMRYVIALSFGNYLKKDGGTDKVMMEHADMLGRNNVSYIQIAPVGRNSENSTFQCYSVVIDGAFVKIIDEYRLGLYFDSMNKSGYSLDTIFIHHFKKFKLEFVKKIIDSTSAPVIVYIHDYFMICKQEQLLRNGIAYCGEDAPSVEKCHSCKYALEGNRFRLEINSILRSLKERLIIVAPSQYALSIWSKSFPGYENRSLVIPHQIHKGIYHSPEYDINELNIAYIGKYIPAKGSDQWRCIVAHIAQQKLKYKCFYFGISEIDTDKCSKVEVSVDRNHLDAMTVALRNNNIHIVIMWANWPETYSYTYYEAMSANCFILTNENSGNIQEAVQMNGNGKVFSDYQDLKRYISDVNSVISDIRNYRNNISDQITPLELLPNEKAIIQLLSGCNNTLRIDCKRKFLSLIKSMIVDKVYRVKYKGIIISG